jgi:hypothetical protein
MLELWAQWGAALGWNQSLSECTWAGVVCAAATGRVVAITLNDVALGGGPPAVIGNLTALETLSLTAMAFVSTIPRFMFMLLRSLKNLCVHTPPPPPPRPPFYSRTPAET